MRVGSYDGSSDGGPQSLRSMRVHGSEKFVLHVGSASERGKDNYDDDKYGSDSDMILEAKEE